MKTIHVTVNGKAVTAAVEPRTHLADFIRESLNLTGTHLGCEHGVCGACTLYIDGEPARSCITLATACDGASVTTIEGFDDDALMRELREAFSREHALQCGYCTPGMLASARDVVLRLPGADEHDIRVAMSGNLCRCTGYVGIVRAIQRVIAERRAKATLPSPTPRVGLGPVGSGHAAPAGENAAALSRAAGALPVVMSPVVTSPVVTSSTDLPKRATSPVGAAAPALDAPQATLRESFVIDHPREQVWQFLGRLEEVVPCLPGASLRAKPSHDRADINLRVKVGPIVAEFEGLANVVRDASGHAGIVRGSARDARSGSTTRGEIRYVLLEEKNGAATRVDIDAGYALAGPLAQFGRSGIVQDIARRMIGAFAENLAARIGKRDPANGDRPETPAAAELNAGSLLWSAIRSRFAAFLRALLKR